MTSHPRRSILDVLLCDDHPITLIGIETIIRQFHPEITIRSANTGEGALSLMRQRPPDLAIVDILIPDLSGLDLIERARAQGIFSPFIFLTGVEDTHLLKQAICRGARGIIRKLQSTSKLIEAITFIQNNPAGLYLDSTVRGFLNQTVDQSLSPREYEVLNWIAKGLRTHEIAEKMSCSVTTIKTFRARILTKTGHRNSSELIAWFFKGNLKSDLGTPTQP